MPPIDRSWTKFSDRLPSKADANESGDVLALESNGRSRPVMWDWVHSDESWKANGFVAWKRHD